MQRHLALLKTLFLPAAKPSPRKDSTETVGQVLDRALREMALVHEQNKERVIATLNLRNNLYNEILDLQRAMDELQTHCERAQREGDAELADTFLHEKQLKEELRRSAQEAVMNAEQMCEQVKVAIKREEKVIRRRAHEIRRLKHSEIQQAMEDELRQIGVWPSVASSEPELDPRTVRELVGFLILLVFALLAPLLLRH